MEKRLLRLWAAAAILAMINLIIFDAIILTAPASLQIQYTPDDAYYYLSLARNFSILHIWTFDSGVSLTTGFHPLLAYLLVAFHEIFQPDANEFVRINLTISILLTISSALIIFWKAWKYQQPVIFASLAILVSARNILINSISGMEWALVVFIVVLCCITMLESHSARSGKVTLFILGVMGSLARLDFGILAFSFVLSSLVIWIKDRDDEYVHASISTLAGASLGVGAVFLHNFVMSGQAIQSSALMKSYWMKGTIHWGVLIVSTLGLLALLAVPIFSGRAKISTSSIQKLFAGAAFFAWINYTVLYLKNSDVHAWYSANILFSIFVFLCSLWNSIQQGRLKKYIYMPHAIFAIIFMVAFLTMAFKTYPVNQQNSEWPHQLALFEAGRYLHLHPLKDGRIGAWNAGILNYYEGGSIVNLDGLVNNDIYAYAVNGSSIEYLQKTNIKYIVDFDSMFSERLLRRTGYIGPQFRNALVPIMTFSKIYYPEWGNLTLYEIEKTE